MKFHIGDKVVVARKGCGWNSDGHMDHWLGKTMTIRAADEYTVRMVEDQEENRGHGWIWGVDDLEPVEIITIVIGGDMLFTTHGNTTVETQRYGDDLESAAKTAITRLFMEERDIKVGDKVKIVDSGCLYTTYSKWVASNVKDREKAARYKYNGNPVSSSTEFTVIAIGQHSVSRNKILAYIESGTNCGECFLIEMDGLAKV